MKNKKSKKKNAPQALFPGMEKQIIPDTRHENKWMKQGYELVAGVDEAGRGPLAGPVVAAAVVLPPNIGPHSRLRQLRDSKMLLVEKREELFELVCEKALAVQWALCTHEEIDSTNILVASLEAMRRAVLSMPLRPHICLVDGNCGMPGPVPSVPIISGDAKCLSIAAASVVAKVIRDRMMMDYHQTYPQYNFMFNKGYATEEHRLAITKHGPCPIHRKTFQGVREFLDHYKDSQPLLWD